MPVAVGVGFGGLVVVVAEDSGFVGGLGVAVGVGGSDVAVGGVGVRVGAGMGLDLGLVAGVAAGRVV